MQYDALMALVALIMIGLFFAGPWQDMCTDFARQVMFEKRDAIFDMAAAGELDFRSKQYRTIRRSLEKSIRFAHDLTIWQVAVLGAAVERMNRKADTSELRAAIDEIENEEVRVKVQRHVFEAQRAFITMLVFKSPVLIVLGLLAALPVLFLRVLRKPRRTIFKRTAEIVQVEAELAGA